MITATFNSHFVRIALLAALLTACTDPTAAPEDLPPRTACVLAAVASDYRSSAVSLLTRDGLPCAPDLLTSGSHAPGLLTALSGDLALPTEPPPGFLFLLDRFPNAVLTALPFLTDEVAWQATLSSNFAGNPQDLLQLPNGSLLTRLERAPHGAEGSDLLYLPIAEVPDAAAARTLDLMAYADPGFDPMPTRLARVGDHFWVGLTHLSRDFAEAGPGRALRLDPSPAAAFPVAVTATLDVPGLTNCGTLSPTATGDLWLTCAGLFREPDLNRRLAHSGLAFLAASEDQQAPTPLTPTWSLSATELARLAGIEPAPLGLALATIDTHRVLAVALGDLVTHRPDRLLLIDRRTTPVKVHVIAESRNYPFTLEDILVVHESNLFLLTDADPIRPELRRFTLPDPAGRVTELTPVTVSRTGLPPRRLGRLSPHP